MLSISKPIRAAGQGEYYLNLAREDYYLDGAAAGEPPGFWLGRGSDALGLRGTIRKDEFRNLLHGRSPDGTQALVRNAGSERRRAGWDLTWSVPKSVSVAWSQACSDVRTVIEASVRSAVQEGVRYLETVGVVTRRGEDGVVREPARLIFTGFEHSTSRAQDPQLHIHTILHNVALRPDGSTGTVEPWELYRHQMAAGTIFRAELAAQLEARLGLRARPHGHSFELMGVDPDMILEFSKRRAQIEAALAQRGLSGGKAAEAAALDTRETKQAVSREALFAQWQAVGRQFHWTARELGWLIHAPYPPRDTDRDVQQVANLALQNLTDRESHFAERQLTQAVAEQCQTRGLGARQALAITRALLASPELVRLAIQDGELHWTTQEMLATEQALLAGAAAMHLAERPVPGAAAQIQAALDARPGLSAEQRAAIAHVCEAQGGIRLVSGLAGTGKSTLFSVAAEVWRSQGRTCSGMALAGKAASGLGEATSIPSQTLHRTLKELHMGRLRLDPHSVLVVDEASMVGTRQLEALVAACERTGATLVLCGDPGQLQPIDAGGPFAALLMLYGAAELTDIRRQREIWARQAVKDIAQGEAGQALSAFDGRGLFDQHDEPLAAIAGIAAAWGQDGTSAPATTLMLANTNADVTALNALAQAKRLERGELTGSPVHFLTEQVFVGDRVVFTRNDAGLGVFNGDLGAVVSARGESVTVTLDRGLTVQVDPAVYPHCRLAYCLTTHKAQGMTAERAFVLLGGGMQDRHTSYVQLSRAREETRLFANEELPDLERHMNRSRPKTLATDQRSHPELVLALGR
ncbi:MAG: relaxase domain-containing protein [Verrucomicrobiales bacterium]|nr:relaxase domain-containing protein [Verrucomicrobiales bacterium]